MDLSGTEGMRSFSVIPEGAHLDQARDGKEQAPSTMGSFFQPMRDSHADPE